ncbi:MAG: AsmA family protein [Chitinophagaceae bacterium]|nr:AsmA family protein [Chitinophagaceae bacterium]
MKNSLKLIISKTLKITGISIGSMLLLLFLIPILFPGTVAEKVKNWTNESIDGEMNFSKVRLSFFEHFPSLTVSLFDFSLKGSTPFKKDTLVAARKISFGINIRSLLFDKKVNIDKIFLADAEIHVLVNEKGEANYNVYKPVKKNTADLTDTAGTALRLERIRIKNSHIVYDDRSLPMLIDARGFNYKGDGDLSAAIFDLNSNINIDSLDFSFDDESYLKNKSVNADLITKINTNSFSFIFQKNKLRINKLPVEFTGKLDFLKNGYDLDFNVTSTNSGLDDFVTALPAQYISWQKNTTIKGKTDLLLKLKGAFITSTNQMPDLTFDMKIREGYVKYDKAPFPVSNIFLNLQTKIPAINPDSLQVKVDSVFFTVAKDYFSAVINTKGINNPTVNAKVNASMDLANLDKAVGWQDVDLQGKCDLHFTANGKYAMGANPNSIRHEEALVSIPSFNLDAQIKNGYLKYASLPQAISNINFNVKSSCADNDYRNTGFSINDLSAAALNNFIKGHLSVSSLKEMMINANVQAGINLAEIKNVYPLKDFDLKGLLKLNMNAKGQYDAETNKFPLTVADIGLSNGSIKTAYYPTAISNIQVTAKATSAAGTLKDQEFIIPQASFYFEGKPFSVNASFKNFEDILYDVKAKGELDIAKIYKVFSQKGIDVSGYVKANLHLMGRQSDAGNKQYNKLNNEGTLELKDIATTTTYLPKPFIIKEGIFTFKQDKMWFNNFKASYGKSDMSMNGYMQNVIDYVLSPKGVLKGNFNLQSDYFNVDEWMVYSSAAIKDTSSKTASVETGVVVIPSNLDISITANANRVAFNGINLDNAKGNMIMNNGVLSLRNTRFNLIGSETILDAMYTSNSINKASFDFKINAKEFDVKKAYDSVKLFRDMATAAGKAQGVISIDYAVKGKLDGNMQPIYPSLEGGGVLSVKKVKVKGFKLFAVVGSKTGKDSIANPDVSKVDIKSKIKNNIITFDRFKIKMAGFRLRMEGQTSFDGRLKLKMRLGLPPLGIIGIPMNVTGTQENPKIKLGKGNNEELNETEYREDEPPQ